MEFTQPTILDNQKEYFQILRKTNYFLKFENYRLILIAIITGFYEEANRL